jgi:hypothetical protein
MDGNIGAWATHFIYQVSALTLYRHCVAAVEYWDSTYMVGQNRVRTPYMAVYLVNFLPYTVII